MVLDTGLPEDLASCLGGTLEHDDLNVVLGLKVRETSSFYRPVQVTDSQPE